MSRSYKKNAYASDGSPKNVRNHKRLANKKVRNSDIPLKGGGYKKTYESWNIHDYISYCSWEDFKKEWYRNNYLNKKCFDLKDLYRHWLKWYHTK